MDDLGTLERSVLAGLLANPDRLYDLEGVLHRGLFDSPARKFVFDAIINLHRRGDPVDLVTVPTEVVRLSGRPMGAVVNAVSSLMELGGGTHVVHYAKRLKASRALLDVAALGVDMQDALTVIPDDVSVSEYLDQCTARLWEINSVVDEGKETTLSEDLLDVFNSMEKRDGDKVVGVSSGFYNLDETVGGFKPGNLVILAARPSMGKSALAMNIMMNAARTSSNETGQGASSVLFTMEMSKSQVVTRMLSSECSVDSTRIYRGGTDYTETEKLRDSLDTLSAMPITIDDSPFQTIHRMRGKLRRLKAEGKVDLAVVDYIGLMTPPSRMESRQQEVAALSGGLKAVAREMEIPIVCLAQLNREVEKNEGGEPSLYNLRESGALEQDADVVLLLWRPEKHRLGDATKSSDVAKIKVAKNREGAIGRVDLLFTPKYTRFDINEDRRKDNVTSEELIQTQGQAPRVEAVQREVSWLDRDGDG